MNCLCQAIKKLEKMSKVKSGISHKARPFFGLIWSGHLLSPYKCAKYQSLAQTIFDILYESVSVFLKRGIPLQL